MPDYFWPVKQQMVILILQFLYELNKLECVHGLAAEPSSTLEASWLPALCAKLFAAGSNFSHLILRKKVNKHISQHVKQLL